MKTEQQPASSPYTSAEDRAQEIADKLMRYSGEEPDEYNAWLNGIKDGLLDHHTGQEQEQWKGVKKITITDLNKTPPTSNYNIETK